MANILYILIINFHIIYDDLGFYIYNFNQMYSIGYFSIFKFELDSLGS
jgi:hypothetical protein